MHADLESTVRQAAITPAVSAVIATMLAEMGFDGIAPELSLLNQDSQFSPGSSEDRASVS